MSEKIVVPVLGESITEATVAKWLKNTGDVVEADEPIVELETDKVNLEVPSPISGVLKEISAKEGESVEVGALLGIITESNNESPTKNTSLQKNKEETGLAGTEKTNKGKNEHLSPAVQRIVTENNLNPSEITPSGKDGLITKGDALNKLSDQDSSNLVSKTVSNNELEERVPMSRLRKVVAKRLKEAQNTAPC